MALILAIEPDRRQAAQLSAVIKRRLDAELILVDTTERALDAIGNRMPDLVLVPALLSPQDDAALAAALRVIAAAAHVQMLTIPVLGTVKPTHKAGGVLSALRRGKAKTVETDGCDPAMFAEQIASYLEHLEEERQRAAHAGHDPVSQGVPAAEAEPVPGRHRATPEPFAALVDDPADPVPTPSPSLLVQERREEPPPATPRAERMRATPPASVSNDVLTDESVSLALEEAVRALFSEPDQPQTVVVEERAVQEEVAAVVFDDASALVAAVDEAIELDEAAGDMQADVEPAPEHVAHLEPQPIELEHVELGQVELAPQLLEQVEEAVSPSRSPASPVDDDDADVEPLFEESMLIAPQAVDPVTAGPADSMDEPEAPLPVSAAAPPAQDDEWEAVEALIARLDLMPLAALEVTTEGEWIGPVSGSSHLPMVAAERAAEGAESKIATDAEPKLVEANADPKLPVESELQAASARSEREWVVLIESLRHDVERLRTERAEKPAKKEKAAPQKEKAAAHRTPKAEAARPAAPPDAARADKKGKPIQDEWGFFDPEQCGFAALLAKLDEVTDDDPKELADQPRRRQ